MHLLYMFCELGTHILNNQEWTREIPREGVRFTQATKFCLVLVLMTHTTCGLYTRQYGKFQVFSISYIEFTKANSVIVMENG